MKDLTLAILTRLKADTAIANVVSTRIYRGLLPTSPTFPAITVSRVDAKRLNLTHNKRRIGQSRIQCTAWATSDGTADNLSELIADSLNAVDNTYMAPGVYVIRSDDQGTVPDSNPDLKVWMYHRDFMIQYYV
jgi:hypothetical protein